MAVRPQELAVEDVLARSPLLARLDPALRARFLACTEQVVVPPRTRLHGDADAGKHLFLILSGEATSRREHTALRRLGPGDVFGELAAAGGRHRGEVITSVGALTAARLSAAAWSALEREDPPLAAALAIGLVHVVQEELGQLTSEMDLVLRGRTLPRAEEITVQVLGQERTIRTGTRVLDLLPAELDGDLVVAGLLGQKPVALSTPIFTDTTVAPLRLSHWEGRQIFAQSMGLLLLEAAHQVAPEVPIRLGPSRGLRQAVEVPGLSPSDLPALATRLAEAMERIRATDAPIRGENWPIDEALRWFQDRGWRDAVLLLRLRRLATVRLVSCGEVYALATGPFLPSTGALRGFRLEADRDGLWLELGDRDPRLLEPAAAGDVHVHPRQGLMLAEHQRWLAAMGVDSVGAFCDQCITGQVAQLIRVAEGFHEKQIGLIADRVAAERERIRIISIAGPSSSGKTTFIKRLTVQLQINGVNPVGIGLDNYYVDREKTPRDAKGEWDFEALEALDLALLQDHVRRLLAGEEVKTARYDFLTGLSHPAGGPTIRLRPGDVLMLEGIHGLNPALLGALPRAGELFRVFLHPATTLPLDRLSRVSATDLRLLRRIVRDRHTRGYSAADNILRWPSVQAGERIHIFPYQGEADAIFDSALIYEPAVLKVFAERYLLEVPAEHPAYPTAIRLRHLIDRFVSIYPDHVPPTSLLREFIGGSGFEY
ncbi:MAG TPA: cyclic nucleotide-binding protein [Anaeromyxobacter sp.]|nr:cyclic nucleotide-binding protein [Anaeromyxobacter sp.]